MKRLHLPAALKEVSAEEGAPTTPPSASSQQGRAVLDILTNTLRMSMELFRPPILYRTLLCCVIYFCSMFV